MLHLEFFLFLSLQKLSIPVFINSSLSWSLSSRSPSNISLSLSLNKHTESHLNAFDILSVSAVRRDSREKASRDCFSLLSDSRCKFLPHYRKLNYLIGSPCILNEDMYSCGIGGLRQKNFQAFLTSFPGPYLTLCVCRRNEARQKGGFYMNLIFILMSVFVVHFGSSRSV